MRVAQLTRRKLSISCCSTCRLQVSRGRRSWKSLLVQPKPWVEVCDTEVPTGTGKFTEALSARPEQYEIVAVEPHDDMRQQLSNKQLPRVTVVNGTAEKMPAAEDGAFAAAVAAQVGRPLFVAVHC